MKRGIFMFENENIAFKQEYTEKIYKEAYDLANKNIPISILL